MKMSRTNTRHVSGVELASKERETEYKNNNRSPKINNFYDIFMFRFPTSVILSETLLVDPLHCSLLIVGKNTININFHKSSPLLLKAFCAVSLSWNNFWMCSTSQHDFHLFLCRFTVGRSLSMMTINYVQVFLKSSKLLNSKIFPQPQLNIKIISSTVTNK